ncbi:MAG: Gfo/Idh/MocA family oxidoreductase, partial [Hyphomicrobiales bacterium]|nr:Gfo/Idh/MocA family oxidoreductase [Hyphomicrobiales bacterium]
MQDAIIIGCGRIGGGDETLSHASAYVRHDGFQLTGCVEPDDTRRKAFMARWNVPRGYRSIQDAVKDNDDWSVASVCTPTPQHAADLRSLLETGVRAVWCEKPLTGRVKESEQLVTSYLNAEKHLAVNYLRRWHPAIQDLQAELAAGKWGTVKAMTGYYTKGLCNNGSHMIDLVHYLAGPLEPVAASWSAVSHEPSDPPIDAILRTRDGANVHLVVGDADDYALFELEIVAAQGTIRIEQSGRATRTRRTMEDPDSSGYTILD